MRGRGSRGRAGGVRNREESSRGGGGFGRGRGRPDSTEDNTQKPLPSGPAPSYHFDVRRAIAAAVTNDAFIAAQKEIVGDDPASLMGVNSILEEVCDACDRHVQALPLESPIDIPALRADIENVAGGFSSCHNSPAASAAFADVFIPRVESRLEKRAPPPKPDDAAPERKHKRVEPIVGANGAVLGDQPIHIPLPRSQQQQQQQQVQPHPSGGLLGNAPPMPPPMQMQMQHYHHMQHHHMQMPSSHHPPSMVNVFNTPAPVQEAPDIGTRYLTLRPLPPSIQSVSALRNALSELTRSCQRRVTYLNVEMFDEAQLQSPDATGALDGDVPPPSTGAYFAVASFTSAQGASEVAHRINTMADRDGTPVRGVGATVEEVILIWGSKREELEGMETELGEELDAYPSTRPAALYTQLDELKAQKAEAFVQITALKASASTQEEKEALKEVFGSVLIISREIEQLSQRLSTVFRLNPAAPVEERQIPPERFSSSSASPTSMGQLLFISGAEAPMPDDMLLLLLRKLGINAVHIWRDPTSTTISVEVESTGVAFGVLRRLDFIDNCICGLTISKEKPRVVEQQQQ